MATINKQTRADGTVTYRVQIRIKGHPAETATFDKKADAKKWASQVETEIRAGKRFGTVEGRKHTLAQAIDRYSLNILPGKRDAENQARQLRWWAQKLGAYALVDVIPARVVEARDELARGDRSPATVNRYLAVLSHLFTIAMKEWQWVQVNPCAQVAKLREPRGRVRCLTGDELTALFAALENCEGSPHLLPIVWLAISTGLRRSSILELRWPDLDLQTGVVRVARTKNDDPIALPLPPEAVAVLVKWGQVRRLGTDLVFPSPEIPTKPIEIGKTFPALVKSAGILNFHFHDLRHCVGSFLAACGATPAQIAQVLGHRTWAMSARYTHAQEESVREILTSMTQKFLVR